MRYLITSALPYVHGIPHLGNFIGSIFPADVMARFLRLKGYEVLFICGSDMHGSPLEVAAHRKREDVKKLAYENHEKIKDLMRKWLISVDYWGHTDSESNKELTYEIFWKLYERGFITEEKTLMPKCLNCGRVLADRWIEGTCPHCGGLARGDQCDDCGAILSPEELINPHCVYCGSTKIEFTYIKHLLFDLPKLKDELTRFFEERKHKWPEYVVKTTEWYLKNLKPRSISRHLNFGFTIPLEDYKDQVFYVWFDAPIGYIGITKEGIKDWERWWKHPHADDVIYVQYMGKDNVFFHSVFFPAMLIGSNNWKLVDIIAASQYLTARGVKFSKSRGVGLNLESALEILDVEYWRYVLAALYPSQKDMEFSWDILMEKINKELVDNISNFIYRTLSLSWKRGIKEVELSKEARIEIDKVRITVKEIEDAYMSYMGFGKVINLVNRLAAMGNSWLNRREPWKEEDPSETLKVALYYVKVIALVLLPILPKTMERVLKILGAEARWEDIYSSEVKILDKPFKLFERIDVKMVEEWKQRFSEEKTKDSVEISVVIESNMRTGKVVHVQDIHENEEHYLLILEDEKGNKYRAVSPLKRRYSPEELKDKVILFIPKDKEIVKGVETNAYIPLADGIPITADKGVIGNVR